MSPTLEERLADLTEQDIFKPQVVIIDGLPFDDTAEQALSELKAFARNQDMKVWFTVLTHRHDKRNASGIPEALDSVVDLFDTVLALQPEGKEIHIRLLKSEKAEQTLHLQLDPATMLVRE